ncbi:MAG TPA: IgA Peptidase M64 [Polyangiaceae bacterium]|nr:IgA Peptidase M64 [Polyangiaceae bacterium]
MVLPRPALCIRDDGGPPDAMKRSIAVVPLALFPDVRLRAAWVAGWLLMLGAALFGCSRGTRRTMRVDYSHSGNATEEHFALERVVVEPLEWPGNPTRAIDETNLGKYFFEVIDSASHRVLYSRGFASIYGEWETTGEAKERQQTFSESFRFPAVSDPAQIVLKKRDSSNLFREIWTLQLDPKQKAPDATKPSSPGPLIEIEKHGPSADKVDFLILGDGYTAAERGKFEKDARRLVDLLFATSPFRERRTDFNVWGLCPTALESGISRPSTGVHRKSPVGATYDAFGSERYILTFDNHALRDVAAFAPYEFIEILTNSNTYGGGGIFNLYSTVAADSLWSPYVFIHEFGHHFAGLADEYYTSDVSFEPAAERTEPWEANVTALRDPNNFKWKDLVSPGVPLPTPWAKEAFETGAREYLKERRQIRAENRPEGEMDALFTRQKVADMKLLSSGDHAGKVGAFEGALYEQKGFFRPQQDCIMFTRDDVPFCSVCRRTIDKVIDFYVKH